MAVRIRPAGSMVTRSCFYGESLPEAVGARATQRARLQLPSRGEGVVLSNATAIAEPGSNSRVLPIAYGEASPSALARAPALPAGTAAPPVRLAVAVLGASTLFGRRGLIITRRARRVRNNPVFNGLWVFPGGGVDKGETLEKACAREFMEETGLRIEQSSLAPIALWQAAVPAQHKQWLIVIFTGDVVAADCLKLQAKEVSAAALLSDDVLHCFVDHWTPGLQHSANDKLTPLEGRLHGWEVDAVTGEMREASFSRAELEGDGGIAAGIGGSHRFGIVQYLRHQACRAHEATARL